MRIAEILGTVTLSRAHPELFNATLKLAKPLTMANLNGGKGNESPSIVVYDDLGAGEGSQILLSESREAAQPFYPNTKPIDAYNAAILDTIHLAE